VTEHDSETAAATIDKDIVEVAIPACDYAAVGSGAELALGALYALESSGRTPRERLKRALSAAEQFNAGVRGPFSFVSTRAAEVDV
jgi:ATP-dependent protease HslVU (ClpYQ) peptidase subunit